MTREDPTPEQIQQMPTVFYKGKPYKLEYKGKTQYGQRAKLWFMNGSDSFWVKSDLLKDEPNPKKSESSNEKTKLSAVRNKLQEWLDSPDSAAPDFVLATLCQILELTASPENTQPQLPEEEIPF